MRQTFNSKKKLKNGNLAGMSYIFFDVITLIQQKEKKKAQKTFGAPFKLQVLVTKDVILWLFMISPYTHGCYF